MCGGLDVSSEKGGAGNLRATKSCVFASFMVSEMMVLKLDEFEFR